MSKTTLPLQRIASVDAYRGLMMLYMAFESWRLAEPMIKSMPESPFGQWLYWQLSHVTWRGGGAWDMIQPSFTFLVGVAMVFSLQKRSEKGEDFWAKFRHVLWRSLILILIGVFLRSAWSKQTYWTFEDTLSQIGLGYPILFLLSYKSIRFQWYALIGILIAYWLLFVLYPLPPAGFDYTTVGFPVEGKPTVLPTGFAAHWSLNTNAAWAFDTWFLNLFPRESPFLFNEGGYSTLSFIPTLGTQILGLIAGQKLLGQGTPTEKIKYFIMAGVIGIAAALLLDITGICPNVKRIWTPSWVLYSGGICSLLLAFFYYFVDVRQHAKFVFPLTIVGMNSIFFYCISDSHVRGYIVDSLKIHLGQGFFTSVGEAWIPLAEGCATLLVFWLITYWLYRNRIFIRV